MKPSLSLLFFPLMLPAATPPIQRVPLDDQVVVTVPVATNRVTTVSFPGPISAIDGAGFSSDPKAPGEFQLAHTPGTSFLSVRALTRKAATNLNIRWNRKTYVFELEESEAPVLAVAMEEMKAAVHPGPVVSPTRLLALLDKAKAYPLLKSQHPESVPGVAVRTFGDKLPVTDLIDYEIRIEEVYRFDAEDTLIFRLLLRNKSDQEIRYRPESFRVRVGQRLYSQSISDAPGVLPAKADSMVYVAISGTPDGGRNELSLKNEFSVLVTRTTPEPPLPPPNHDPLPTFPEEGRP